MRPYVFLVILLILIGCSCLYFYEDGKRVGLKSGEELQQSKMEFLRALYGVLPTIIEFSDGAKSFVDSAATGGRIGWVYFQDKVGNVYPICHSDMLSLWNGARFVEFKKKYGSIHNTPWNEFTIEEKVVIAMYGGSGSKLEKEEVEEWAGKYAKAN